MTIFPHPFRTTTVLAAVSLSLGAASAAWVSSAGTPSGPQATPARSREPTEALLVQLLDRSEVGDIAALRGIRGSISSRGLRAVIDVRLAAARLDLRGVRAAMHVVEAQRTPIKWRAIALAIEAGAAFADGDYKLSASDSAAWLALPAGTDPMHSRDDMAQMAAIAVQLAPLPRQEVTTSSPGSSRTWRDKATLVRTAVNIEGIQQEAVLDTGANLSVVSESTAQRLGLATIDGGSVRSSSRDAVPVRLAIAKRLSIAGTSLSDVVFLVLKDSDLQLPLPGGYEIPAIIGLPVLKALGRLTLDPTSIGTGGNRSQARQEAPLVASGSDLFVLTRVNGLDVPLHLDSGASATSLGNRFAKSHPEVVRGLEVRATRSAGAGGAIAGSARVLRNAVVDVGGVSTRIPAIDIETAGPAKPGPFGTLGQDVLRADGGSYTIDFTRMTITIERPEAGR